MPISTPVIAENKAVITSKLRGFLLIEIVIALAVLAIATTGLISVFTLGTKKSSEPLILGKACALAQEKMEETISLKKTGGCGAVVPVAPSPFTPPVADFTWSREVYCVTAADLNTSLGSPPCASGYAHVTVAVNNPTLGTVTLETVLVNY